LPKDLYIILFTAAAVAVSLVFNRDKTWEGIRRGVGMIVKILPQFLLLVVLVSVFLGIVPRDTLVHLLGRESGAIGVLIAAGIGSVTLMPGPIAYPLAGMLLKNDVTYTVIAVFVTTLMMVGVVTFPVEKEYLGFRIALLRNALSLAGALTIGLLMGALL
jgi:uncharacterized membrane protein YraQ (UPF0718 family)